MPKIKVIIVVALALLLGLTAFILNTSTESKEYSFSPQASKP